MVSDADAARMREYEQLARRGAISQTDLEAKREIYDAAVARTIEFGRQWEVIWRFALVKYMITRLWAVQPMLFVNPQDTSASIFPEDPVRPPLIPAHKAPFQPHSVEAARPPFQPKTPHSKKD